MTLNRILVNGGDNAAVWIASSAKTEVLRDVEHTVEVLIDVTPGADMR